MKKIALIIPTFNRKNLLYKTLNCLVKQVLPQNHYVYFYIAVDGSTDGTIEMLQIDYPQVNIIHGDGNWWWTKSINEGVKEALKAKCDLILTLNDDLEVKEDYLATLLQVVEGHPNALIGSVCVDIKNPNKIFHAGVSWNFKKYTSYPLHLGMSPNDLNAVYETDSHPGRGTLIPAQVFYDIGLYDELNFPQYAADDDFSIRAKKKGYPLLMSAKSIIYSHIEETASGITRKKSLAQYYKGLFSKRTSYNLKYSTIFVWRHSMPGYKVLNTLKNIVIKLVLPFYHRIK